MKQMAKCDPLVRFVYKVLLTEETSVILAVLSKCQKQQISVKKSVLTHKSWRGIEGGRLNLPTRCHRRRRARSTVCAGMVELAVQKTSLPPSSSPSSLLSSGLSATSPAVWPRSHHISLADAGSEAAGAECGGH